jgi:hypothetical protein
VGDLAFEDNHKELVTKTRGQAFEKLVDFSTTLFVVVFQGSGKTVVEGLGDMILLREIMQHFELSI